jgi:hypothetical protein
MYMYVYVLFICLFKWGSSNRRGVIMQSLWNRLERPVNAVQSRCNRRAIAMNAAYTLYNRFPLRFSKDDDPTAFVICSRTQKPSLGVLGDSTAFRGDAMAISQRCWRSARRFGDNPDRRENAALE